MALDSGRGIRQLRGLPGSVMQVVFSRDGKRLAALSDNWWTGVWNRDTGRLVRLCYVPRGQFTGNADLAFSPDARSLAVSAGNTATLWNVESGAARRWQLPWGLADAIAFPDAEHLMLMRVEVRDGSRPPDSQAPPMSYPRVCVIRNLLGRNPKEPVKTIIDLNWGVKEIEASPDGTHFLVDGRGGADELNLSRQVRAYQVDGTFVSEILPKIPLDPANGKFTFDPTGRLLIHYPKDQPVLFELPSLRFMGPTPITLISGVSQDAQLWVGYAFDEGGRPQIYDRDGKVLLDRIPGAVDTVHFSPDLDGRYLIWGNRLGAVCVADLVEVRRRLTEIGLGW
ncbi:MAG: WD40 repeat domain-containing protein [Isosphaerales bacterium]